jgi:hypothetical protein
LMWPIGAGTRCFLSKRACCLFAKFNCGQEYRELFHALCTIAFVCSFGPERLRCAGADLHHLCNPGNHNHIYDAGHRDDRHERAGWLSTELRGASTHNNGNSYSLAAVRAA